jgi:hypothetical protein
VGTTKGTPSQTQGLKLLAFKPQASPALGGAVCSCPDVAGKGSSFHQLAPKGEQLTEPANRLAIAFELPI